MEGNNIEIVDVNEDIYEKVLAFLGEVKTLNIEEEIVKNASVIMDLDEVVGAISYEKFGYYGLIRYFIFKKYVDDDIIENLFLHLEKKASKDEIRYLFSIVMDKDVMDLFDNLSFIKSEIILIDLYIDSSEPLLYACIKLYKLIYYIYKKPIQIV